MPATIEARVAYLEGKVEEHSRGFGETRELILQLGQRIDQLGQRIDHVDQKVDRFREELSDRIAGVERSLNQRIDALDQKVSRQFMWIVGIQVATILAVVGALIGVA